MSVGIGRPQTPKEKELPKESNTGKIKPISKSERESATSEVCPHWKREADDGSVVLRDKCSNPNCENWFQKGGK